MPAQVVCPSCQVTAPAPDAAIGSLRRCPKCKAVGNVKAASARQPASLATSKQNHRQPATQELPSKGRFVCPACWEAVLFDASDIGSPRHCQSCHAIGKVEAYDPPSLQSTAANTAKTTASAQVNELAPGESSTSPPTVRVPRFHAVLSALLFFAFLATVLTVYLLARNGSHEAAWFVCLVCGIGTFVGTIISVTRTFQLRRRRKNLAVLKQMTNEAHACPNDKRRLLEILEEIVGIDLEPRDHYKALQLASWIAEPRLDKASFRTEFWNFVVSIPWPDGGRRAYDSTLALLGTNSAPAVKTMALSIVSNGRVHWSRAATCGDS